MTKSCSQCGAEKPLTDFYPHSSNDRSTRTHLAHCKECSKAGQRRYRRTEKGQRALRALSLRKFGITPEKYDQMFVAQKGLCAICGDPETAKRGDRVKALAVDHDHVTGRVRGLLCTRCNTAIGLLRDRPESLRAAIDYFGRDA